jgi:hypothetical protein
MHFNAGVVSGVKFGERILRNALADNDDDSSQSDRQSIANRLLCFRQPSCLDAQAKKNEEIILEFYGTRRCCLTVYVLGDHLDRTQVKCFSYCLDPRFRNCRMFTNEELRRLGLHPRIQRSSPYLFQKYIDDK